MIKMIVNLGNNKCEDNTNSAYQLSGLRKLLLMSIVDAPEKGLVNVDFGNQT